jgi:hypothetical protein
MRASGNAVRVTRNAHANHANALEIHAAHAASDREREMSDREHSIDGRNARVYDAEYHNELPARSIHDREQAVIVPSHSIHGPEQSALVASQSIFAPERPEVVRSHLEGAKDSRRTRTLNSRSYVAQAFRPAQYCAHSWVRTSRRHEQSTKNTKKHSVHDSKVCTTVEPRDARSLSPARQLNITTLVPCVAPKLRAQRLRVDRRITPLEARVTNARGQRRARLAVRRRVDLLTRVCQCEHRVCAETHREHAAQ